MEVPDIKVGDQVGILKGYYSKRRGCVTKITTQPILTIEVRLEGGTVVYYYDKDVSDGFITKEI